MADFFSIEGRKIWVAGHKGLVGGALVRHLARRNCEILTVEREKLDLRSQYDTQFWIEKNDPDVIILAAARVGGIHANASESADFLYDNLAIAQNVIHAAALCKTRKLVFLGSSCIYPRMATQPIVEEALLSGPFEPTNEAYAIAKIAGLKLCQYYHQQYGHNFISLMPCNLYGPGDRWDDRNAHVIPSLISKFHKSKVTNEPVSVWGSGKPLREFLHVDDAADGIIYALERYSGIAPLNLGSGDEISIADLAMMIKKVTNFEGNVEFDYSMPDGAPRKILNSNRLRTMGWRPEIKLYDGLCRVYEDFLRTR